MIVGRLWTPVGTLLTALDALHASQAKKLEEAIETVAYCYPPLHTVT